MKKELVQASKDASHHVTSSYSLRQKRCWALVVDNLQSYIDMDIDWENIPTEKLKEIVPLRDRTYDYLIPITAYHIDGKASREKVFKELLEATASLIIYKKNEVFRLISGFVYDGNTYFASLPLVSLRWILDFGQKQKMFVTFHKPTFMKLSTSYSQNLFLLLSEFYSSGYIKMDIETFKSRMSCPDTYDAQKIRDKILLPSIAEFKRVDSNLGLVFRFSSNEKKSTKGRKRLDTIEIAVTHKNNEGEFVFNADNNKIVDKKWEA